MEEWVGEIWHKVITRSVDNSCRESRVHLADYTGQLSIFFKALGGEQGKTISADDSRPFKIQLTTLQKMAGTHRKFPVCWQNQNLLSLPKHIDYFASTSLNESLYFWLSALAAFQPSVNHWFRDNQVACQQLIQRRPGLGRMYHQLLPEVIALRPALTELKGDVLEREKAIRQALYQPGSVDKLPSAKGDPIPVILWQYPPPIHSISVQAQDADDEDLHPHPTTETTSLNLRKQAQRVDDNKKTDGLLVFQLESLFSWTEQIQLDRREDEQTDEDLTAVAQDLDIITVARQRRSRAAKVRFDIDLPAAEHDDLPLGTGVRLPEWDYRKNQLINDYCLLQPMLADEPSSRPLPEHLESIAASAKKKFSIIQPDKLWLKRQPLGDELDIDSWLESKFDPCQESENGFYYKHRVRQQRDLSCLLLADLSLSTDATIADGRRVIDVIRDTLFVFGEMLSDSQDEFAIYGFSSIKNTLIRYHLFKNFSEPYTDHCRGRIDSIRAGYYTRMGAAIRQSSNILNAQQSQQKLLLLISDGKPNDSDQYETRYGIEDTKHAISQARQMGLKPFCITVDNEAGKYMPYLFGDNGFTLINNITTLPSILPKLYMNLTA